MPIRFSILMALLCAGSGWAAAESETGAEAPANVRVIPAGQIRRYGYRTLGEALAAVRGFSLPGDFNTRCLVMLNGHPLTDNIYDSNNFFGQDFGLDLDLVERIEIIRGPTSALYGSNGLLASIHVVTRSPVHAERLHASAETDSFGEHKLSVASSLYLGGGANLPVSGAVFHNAGISFPLSGLDLPAGVRGPVSNAGGERGFHSFANLIWHGWSFTAYFNEAVGGQALARLVSKARLGVPVFGGALGDRLAAGVRNALDRQYEGPIHLTAGRLRGGGRPVFLRLVWRVWE
jgi:iron complex outermembrane receptor protein